jgi:hypothetical protein
VEEIQFELDVAIAFPACQVSQLAQPQHHDHEQCAGHREIDRQGNGSRSERGKLRAVEFLHTFRFVGAIQSRLPRRSSGHIIFTLLWTICHDKRLLQPM